MALSDEAIIEGQCPKLVFNSHEVQKLPESCSVVIAKGSREMTDHESRACF